MSSPTWTPAALASESVHYEGLGWRFVEAQHRVSTLKLVDTLEEQSILESLIEMTKTRHPRRLPASRLPARHAVSLRCRTPYRIPVSPSGTCRWRLLRLRGVRDRRRRDRLLPSALLRRVARDAVAEGGPRIHGVQRRVGSQSCDRSEGPAVRRVPRDLDASEPLRTVPGAGGRGQECPTRADTIRIRSRSARRRQSGRARLRGVLRTASDRAPYLAHSDRRSRSAGTLRVPETRGRIPARNLHGSQAGFALMA